MESVDLQRLPKGIYINQCRLVQNAEGVLVVQCAEIIKAGIEDLHGFFAHFLDVTRVRVNRAVGAGIVDKLGIGDGGLRGEHVVDEALGELLVLAAGGDTHRQQWQRRGLRRRIAWQKGRRRYSLYTAEFLLGSLLR